MDRSCVRMTNNTSLQTSALISLFLESLLFGVFSTVFFTALYAFWSKRSRNREPARSIISLCIMVAMYILAVMHSALGLARILCAFISYDGSEDTVLQTVSNPYYLTRTVLYVCQTFLGDIFLMYRTYIIWGKSRWINIVFSFFLVGMIVTDVSCSVVYIRAPENVGVFELLPWTLAFFLLTLLVNVTCASLISYKIWVTRRDAIPYAEGSSNSSWKSSPPAVKIIIESGILYTVLLVTSAVLYAGKNWCLYILLDALMQFIGLVFSLIILRVALGLSIDNTAEQLPIVLENISYHRRIPKISLTRRKPDTFAKGMAVEVLMTRDTFVSDDKNVVLGEQTDITGSEDSRSVSSTLGEIGSFVGIDTS